MLSIFQCVNCIINYKICYKVIRQEAITPIAIKISYTTAFGDIYKLWGGNMVLEIFVDTKSFVIDGFNRAKKAKALIIFETEMT